MLKLLKEFQVSKVLYYQGYKIRMESAYEMYLRLHAPHYLGKEDYDGKWISIRNRDKLREHISQEIAKLKGKQKDYYLEEAMKEIEAELKR